MITPLAEAQELTGNNCPYCNAPMAVAQMTCHACNVTVHADFPTQRLARLPIEQQRFIELFVLAGGSLKKVATQAGVSYPTVRSRLDKVIDTLRREIAGTPPTPDSVGALMTPADAARIIKRI